MCIRDRLLSIPNGVYPLFGLVMGYPLENSDEAAKPRLPLDVVLKEEKYHTDGEEEQIRASVSYTHLATCRPWYP